MLGIYKVKRGRDVGVYWPAEQVREFKKVEREGLSQCLFKRILYKYKFNISYLSIFTIKLSFAHFI